MSENNSKSTNYTKKFKYNDLSLNIKALSITSKHHKKFAFRFKDKFPIILKDKHSNSKDSTSKTESQKNRIRIIKKYPTSNKIKDKFLLNINKNIYNTYLRNNQPYKTYYNDFSLSLNNNMKKINRTLIHDIKKSIKHNFFDNNESIKKFKKVHYYNETLTTLDEKKNYIDKYVNKLLNNDNKFNMTKYAWPKILKRKEKFPLTKSICPIKYIEKNLIDSSYNVKNFKTYNLQIKNIFGKEKFRDDNIQQIQSNQINIDNIVTLKFVPDDSKLKEFIDDMFYSHQQLDNLYFGKKKISYKRAARMNEITSHFNKKISL